MIYILLMIGMLGYACSDDKDNALPTVRPEAKGTWVDTRGEEPVTYHWVRYVKLDWMCENMKLETAPGTCFPQEITDDILQQYGYLYDFETAKTLAVDEWRLPTDEDWKALEQSLGMAAKEANAEEWRGDQVGTLMMQDSTGSGLNLGCAGYYYTTGGSGVRNTGIDGIYWSATLDSQSQGYAWTRMVIYNRSDVRRFSMLTKKGLSVRLVRDAK